MEKRKTVKTGDDVIHFNYFGNLISQDELGIIERELRKHVLQLSSYDQS
ncbi:hypothetical protein [Treponema endosymbiont of Eucomonympha sp.]|nr:hypothetical protein [Treponema endosymbiont of Eucomonympha sp.]